MHANTDPSPTTETPDQLTPSFIARLLAMIIATIPGTPTDTQAAKAELQEFVRILFAAFHPQTPIEAAVAARAITAWFAAMDLLGRAARPGLADDTVRRLRGTANATARAFDAALRERAKRQPKPLPAQPAAAPAPQPAAAAPQPKPAAPNRAPTPEPRRDPRLTPGPRSIAAAKDHPMGDFDTLLAAARALGIAARGNDFRTALQTSVALPTAILAAATAQPAHTPL